MDEFPRADAVGLRGRAGERVGGGFVDGEGRGDGFDGRGGGVEAEALVEGGAEEGAGLGDVGDGDGWVGEGAGFGADAGEVGGGGVDAGEEPEDDVVGVDVHAGERVGLAGGKMGRGGGGNEMYGRGGNSRPVKRHFATCPYVDRYPPSAPRSIPLPHQLRNIRHVFPARPRILAVNDLC